MLWVEILNRGSEWAGPEAAGLEAMEVGGESSRADVERDFAVLRWSFASRALGLALPPGTQADLRSWLEAITLRSGDTTRWQGFALPALRASRTRSSLPDALELLLSTALVQLLATPDVTGVSRCHAARRSAAEPGWWGDELDAAFRGASDLDRWLDDAWRQCPRLVVGARGAHYCSKACSNAAFAARKGARDPRYFAAKQAQYRDRQRRRAAAQPGASAVLFVD